jgi:predicted ATP-dependent serine protease
MFDPSAYERKKFEPQRITTKKQEIKELIEPQKDDSEKGSKFLTFSEIQNRDRSQIVTMPSGFRELDQKIIGFNKGEITLWSGKNGAAKSTIINQIALNHVQQGFKGIIYSGELPAYKLKNWIQLQAAGRQYTTQSDYNENVYYVKKSIGQRIDTWINDKLFIYNNDYGNNFEQLMSDVEQQVVKNHIDFDVLDNLMALDLLTFSGDKYDQQKQFINMLCSFVRRLNIHIHIIAHPRKQVGFLRKDDISGTADLGNAVDNIIICHRNNADYRKAIETFFDKSMVGGLVVCDNYMEVCKNRDLGIVDHFAGLFFEKESKRLLNELSENINYDWQELEVQRELINIQPN